MTSHSAKTENEKKNPSINVKNDIIGLDGNQIYWTPGPYSDKQ